MSHAPLTTLTDTNFATEVLNASQPVLVEFGATWCPPCRALEPVVAALATQYAGRVKVGTLDVDACPRAATQFEVRSVPTLLLFKDGQVIGQIVGAVGKTKLESLVQRGL